jgi:hypothetical protein
MAADILSKTAAGIILAGKDFPTDSPFFKNKLTTLEQVIIS